MFDLQPSSVATLTQENGGGAGQSIFADLGEGDSYGSFTVPSWIGHPAQYVLSVELSAAAVNAINATEGMFAMGIRNTTPSNTNHYFLFSSTSRRASQMLVLDVQPIPEPATNTLMLAGLVTVATLASRCKGHARRSSVAL